jgi:hypothetical protein
MDGWCELIRMRKRNTRQSRNQMGDFTGMGHGMGWDGMDVEEGTKRGK